MKRGLSVAVLAATVATLLAAHVSSVHAQPVARIALPRPRGTVPLYPGCNNIALSFPDGTDSQTVVQAVTPAGMVEAMWRHDAALNKFEGFSPPAPQASDLLTVNLWDAVWLCIGRAPLGPTPTPTPAPALTSPTPTPMLTWTPTPAAQLVADLAVTDIFPDNLPQGEVYARITNNGPDSLTSVDVQLGCSAVSTDTMLRETVIAIAPRFITVSLNPGETEEFDTKISVDNSCAKYEVTCEVKASSNDPNAANDSYSEEIPLWSAGGWRCPY